MKISKKAKITNIQINLDEGDKIYLTLEQAKDLYETLDEFFGKEEKIKLVPVEKQMPNYPIPRNPDLWYSDSTAAKVDLDGYINSDTSLDPDLTL